MTACVSELLPSALQLTVKRHQSYRHRVTLGVVFPLSMRIDIGGGNDEISGGNIEIQNLQVRESASCCGSRGRDKWQSRDLTRAIKRSRMRMEPFLVPVWSTGRVSQ